MKFKLTVLLATFVVTMGLLLGTSAAQAAEVIFDPVDTDRAIGITDLVVDGTPYNVAFTAFTAAAAVYGEFPGVFDFITSDSAAAAVDAVNAALNDAGADGVGADASNLDGFYRLGFASELEGDIESVTFWEGTNNTGSWVIAIDPDIDSYNLGERVWADFTLAGPAPDPVTIGGTVYDGATTALLLQNNDTDYLLKFGTGPFVFEEKLMPGDSYDVSVPFISSQEPTQPEWTCIVINGSGEVPPQNVTNVLVACGPAADPVTIGGTVNGLESDSGLVLQNNLTDDKPIAADGEFTFDTLLQPGGIYSVTVLTNPTNPAQDCFVSGGSGPVPYEDITNVAVTCAPPDEGPPPPDSNTVCEREECLADPDKLAQCNEMMEECLATAENDIDIEQCTGAALLICGLF